MPRLKKLVLQGFKSFADSSSFLFPTGITAVVGPNGSGKSNIADAIRWVLGEQRMTAIRGRTGEDMIFAGTSKRSRAGMARAAITFDNQDGWLPVDFAEVTVERRTYRDGTSDYILNGNKVRLMDLRDLLDRASLGRDAYLVIGQGLVDQVLSLRPQERLALFEQAAGITPYRSRREDALDRLEETQRNLQRVYDIVGEIEPRLRRLERQAARAEDYVRVEEELSHLLRTWYGYRWNQSLIELEQVRRRVTHHEDRALALLEQSEALTARAVEQQREIGAQRERLARLHRESSAQHDEAAQRQRQLAVARERRRQFRERLEETTANLAPLRSSWTSEAEDVTALEAEVQAAVARLNAAQVELREAEAAHAGVAERRHALLRRQTEAQSRALETRHRLADRRSRLEQAQARVAELTEQVRELEATRDVATTTRREQQAAVEQARRHAEAQAQAQAELQAEAQEIEQALEAARTERDHLAQHVGRQQAEHQRVTARWEALERLQTEGAGMYAGVRAVLSAVQREELTGLPGPISSLIRVPAELERAIETALGSQLQNIVAESWDHAQAAIEWLKRHRAGRATLLPLDSLHPPSPLNVPELPGILGLGSDLVSYDDAYRPAVELLLNRTVVAQDLDAARRLHRRLRSGFRIVTLEGDIVRSGGSITGGEDRRSGGPGLLSRERECRELRRQTKELRRELDELSQRHARAEAEVERLAARRADRRAVLRDAADQAARAERELAQRVRELERTIETLTWQEERLSDATEELQRLNAAEARLQREVDDAEQQLAALDAELQQVDAALAELADDETAQWVSERRTEVAVLEQELESRRVLLESRRREVTRLQRQIAGQEQRVASLEGEIAAVERELSALTTTYEEARAEADGLAAQIPPLENRLAEMEASLQALEAEEQQGQRALREAEQRLTQVELEAGRREDQLQALQREIEESLDFVAEALPETQLEAAAAPQPLPPAAIAAALPAVDALPEGTEPRIRELRRKLKRLQPVNLAAREEYQELAERHSFLREQIADLEQASDHLRQIIGELDEMMDTMFSTTFTSISTEFERVFELLFNGGAAKLTLVDDEDDRAGVEILARPPGKRTSGLSMLSGGERTLTATALLFAVMRVSPTPFCVLDEVDAMLDEANVSRFRRMLHDLARDTQFVIITHNRGTVEVADTIYGVSMGEDGVSQPLSLSLEDLPASETV